MNARTARLGDIATIDRDGIDAASIPVGTRYVGLENIESGGHSLSFARVETGQIASTKFRFNSGHVLFGKLRPYLAKIVCPEFEGVCSTDILPIRPGPKLDQRYLTHFLRLPKTVDWAASRATGVNLPRLSPRQLESLEIPLPPLDEQRRIAAILDKADALRRKRKHALELLDGLISAVFREHTDGIARGGAGWPARRFGEICTVVRGSSPRPQGDKRYFGGPVPRLMIADITRDGKLVTPSIDSLTELGAKKSRPMLKGDVVMAVSGAVGLPAILAKDACIHDGFVGFRDLSPDIKSEFLYHVLKSMQAENRQRATGAIWVNLTTDQVANFSIPMPPLSEQIALMSKIEAIDRTSECAHAGVRAADGLFASLQHRAFSGQL